jgi:hypothetical protein
MLLCVTNDDQLINKWKKEIGFNVKIKFHLNESIKWHCMQIKFNWNGFQIDGEGIENLLMNMVLWKRNFIKTYIQKTQFHGKVVEGVSLEN